MLQSLSIRDFVIVDKLDLEFTSGFTVLTGETGAGKSILIDALSLTLGARGEAGVIRTGCEKAEISAFFSTQNLTNVDTWLNEQALSYEQGELLLRRVMYADGRTRAFINGQAVTVAQLKELGELLVDIYSQHAHHSLLKTSYQRQVLDDFAGMSAQAKAVAASYKAWQEVASMRAQLEANAHQYAEELAILRDEVRELKQLVISEADWEALQQEHARISNSASLIQNGATCYELLAEHEFSVIDQLSQVQHHLDEMVKFDSGLAESVEAVQSSLIQLEEASRNINRFIQRAELDPQRLENIESQMQALHDGARKYRSKPESLMEVFTSKQARMQELESYQQDDALIKQETTLKADYMQLAQALSKARISAAKVLSQKISHEMQSLALAGGQFEVVLTAQTPDATGLEDVQFLVAGHAGVEPKPLAKVASGGELSRISLAIRVTTAQQINVPTMIFDEVDVGIGGGVAEVVGRLLAQLGKTRQVLVITHLPQVASCGAQHFRVSKTQQDGHTLSHITALDDTERIEEVARMLGGIDITQTTRQHAAEMLNAR